MRFNILCDTYEAKYLHETLQPALRNKELDFPLLTEFFQTLTEILQDKTNYWATPRMIYDKAILIAKQGPLIGKEITLVLYAYGKDKTQLAILADNKFVSQDIDENEKQKVKFRKFKRFFSTEAIKKEEVKEVKDDKNANKA